jgi:hypothetical protein
MSQLLGEFHGLAVVLGGVPNKLWPSKDEMLALSAEGFFEIPNYF